jgi:hypothetical protein
VRSVTTYNCINCIYHLRRAAELLAPTIDFSWLAEVEKDLALVMEPRSKFDRLVLTERLVGAGLTLARGSLYPAETNKRAAPSRANAVLHRRATVLQKLMPHFITSLEESCRQGIGVRHWFDMHGTARVGVAAAGIRSLSGDKRTNSQSPDRRCRATAQGPRAPKLAGKFIAVSVALSVRVSLLELLQCLLSDAEQLTPGRGRRPLDRRKTTYEEQATFGLSPCAVP